MIIRSLFLKASNGKVDDVCLAITHWCGSLTDLRFRSVEKAVQLIGIDFLHQITDAVAR